MLPYCLNFIRQVTLLLINELDVRTIQCEHKERDAVGIRYFSIVLRGRIRRAKFLTIVLLHSQDPSSVSLEIPTAPPLTAWSLIQPFCLLLQQSYPIKNEKRKSKKGNEYVGFLHDLRSTRSRPYLQVFPNPRVGWK